MAALANLKIAEDHLFTTMLLLYLKYLNINNHKKT